jgi:glyoxylase-like metal-dependent hydrolase (beta-lactamase superfamily II)
MSLVQDHGGDVLGIDSGLHGWEGVTAVYYLPGARPAIIDTAAGSSIEAVLEGLEEAGANRLDWIVLTHIHLDHAGAAGHLAKRFPTARVVVRKEGAAHLVNPAKLWASASRLYPDMEGSWGRMLPIPEDRLVVVSEDGPAADLGGGRSLRAIHTPGHAQHQMALIADGPPGPSRRRDMFVGDAIGVRLPDAGYIRPATAPPGFDLEMALKTIERLQDRSPGRVFPTHFGPVPDPDAAFDEAARRLKDWVAVAETVLRQGGGVAEMSEEFAGRRDEFYPQLDPSIVDKFESSASAEMNARGIYRYLTREPSPSRS